MATNCNHILQKRAAGMSVSFLYHKYKTYFFVKIVGIFEESTRET